jgi:hypothetical protein
VAFSDGAIVAQASHAIDGNTVPIIDNECQKTQDKRPVRLPSMSVAGRPNQMDITAILTR